MYRRPHLARSNTAMSSFVRARPFPVMPLLLLTLIITAAVAGCGARGGIAAYTTSATQTATAAATATAGKKATVANAITITLDKQQYAADGVITVTVSNGLSTAIMVADHQTNCSIVVLQTQTNGGWQSIRNCRIMTPTRLVPLAAGSVTTVRLVPGGGQIATTPWAPGTYRVLLTYSAGPSDTPSSGAEATSANFTIA